MIDDYSNFCEMFFAAHYLPIALYKGHQYVCSAGFYDNTDPYPFVTPKLCDASSPSVYVSSDTGYYGYVVCKDKQHFFILGPAYSTPPDRSFIRSYMTKNGLPIARYDEIASFLTAIPLYTYNQFLELLLFLHFILNGEKLDLNEAFRLTDTKYQLEIGKQQAERAYTAREEQAQHGTYLFEQQMLSLVRQGDVTADGGFLQEHDNFISQRGKHIFQRLGKNDMPHGCRIAKAQASAGFKLPDINGHNAGTHDFRHICAGVDAETGNRRINFHIAGGKNQICNNKNLKVNRRCANYRNIQATQLVQNQNHRIFVPLCDIFYHCNQHAQQDAQQHRKQGNNQCISDTFQISGISSFCKEGVIIPLRQIDDIIQNKLPLFDVICLA